MPIIVSVFTITVTLFLTNIFTITPKHISGVAGSSKSRIEGDDDDVESCCSTCSSSSSSDEAAAYALPPRRAYGGVRISYVPNDAVACARKRTPTSSMSNQAHRDADKCIVSWWSPEEFQWSLRRYQCIVHWGKHFYFAASWCEEEIRASLEPMNNAKNMD